MIGVSDCIAGTALICNPCRKDYNILIGKQISKLFFMHGKSYDQNTILSILKSLIETYNYETPQTILLFLKKAANGDFGKFFGEPDIGTVREWFTDFLQSEIIPAREMFNKGQTSGTNERNKAKKGIEPISQIYTKITNEKEFEKGKGRNL